MTKSERRLPQFEYFHNDTAGKLNFSQVIDEVLSYVAHDKRANYKIFIGSDSLSYDTKVSIVSTVVVYRVGNGGRYFWHRFQKDGIHNLRGKIHAEVECSIELAQKVLKALGGKIENLPENLEIHADVGNSGDTRDLIAEITGWIKAYGIRARTKPNAVAASSVADRQTILPSKHAE